jgi:hypothetical protein
MQMKIWGAVALAGLVCVQTQVAYSAVSSLSGTVFHSNGSAVADAPVRAVNETLGVDARTRSSADGRYEFTELESGTYTVSVNMPCCEFIPFADLAVVVEADRANHFDVHMAPGNLFVEGDDPATVNAQLRNRQIIPDGPVPRLANGKPDLSGVWLTSEDPFPEAPKALPWAQKLADERAATWFVDDPMLRCLPGAPPIPGASSFMTKFVAKAGLLVILLEDIPGFRQVFLDGREHPDYIEPSWTGYSVGRWEGDTLVIETTGYNSRGWVGSFPRTEELRMVERYSRPDVGHLKLELTFEDPGVFEAPWTQNMVWDLAPQEDVMEYVCENNKWMDASEGAR